jgi:hypothetical protein
MNALRIGDVLFVQTLRKRGFLASLLLVALLLLALAELTGFGLGRELLMVREAGLGTLFIASFLGALLASVHATQRSGRRWIHEARSRLGGPRPLALGLLFHPVFTAFWTALFLVPFFAASVLLFHGNVASGILCALLGALARPAGVLLERSTRPGGLASLAPVAVAACVASAFLPAVSGGKEILCVLAFAPASLLAASLLPGLFAVLIPGPGGWIAAASLFLASNMKETIAAHPVGRWAASLLPDLYALNPSLAITRNPAVGKGDIAGALAYAILFALGVLLVTLGTARFRSATGSLAR